MPARAPDPALVRSVVTELRSAIEAREGTLTMSAAQPELARAVEPWGSAGPSARVMQDLKRAFDPRRVMAPGRFAV